ncbi:glycosyltransferase [Seohaeicola saemankumensis]|nr:glycosyltransferase family 2 protein [Seohaeicola saemankumensis]MCA0872112.1 glycosyltransferase [Seohaeicola saemankumensis]
MKISIIIPTRERAFYLDASIRTVLEIDDADIELIVADNASTDNTREVVQAFDDPRLIYLPSDARVSMRENFNRSLVASSGDYVIFIGDDDAVLTGQFPILRRLLEQEKPDGVSWFKSTYGWPIEGYGKKTGGIRFYRDECFGAPVEYDPRSYLDALMRCDLGQLYPTPNIYHGCVSRAYLDRIAPKPGLYFDSTIPDVNLQYRSIYLGGRFLHTFHPFTINGYGPASTGGAHQSPKPGTASDKIGKAFVAENRADPYDDIIDHALTIQLVFLATLETLRARGGFDDPAPDYTAWYRLALNAARAKPEEAARVGGILDSYAEQTGTRAQLDQARAQPPLPKRKFAERLARVRGQLRSFRRSAEENGQNTVLTATHVVDAVLGADYGAVLDGSLSPARAWKQARNRARAFKTEL